MRISLSNNTSDEQSPQQLAQQHSPKIIKQELQLEITNMPDLEVSITDFNEGQDQENTNIHEIIRNFANDGIFAIDRKMIANVDYEEVEIMKMVNYDNDTTVIIKEEMDVIEDGNWLGDSSFGSGILNSDRFLVMKYRVFFV